MKVIKKTFLTAAVLVFSIALCLLSAVLVLAACSEKVTLRFETNGGTYLESVEGKVGTAYTVPAEPQKEGYYFEGWYLNSDFSGSPQELPESMPDESRTYYAKYGRYPVLTLIPGGGSVTKTTHLIKPGVNLTSFLKEYEPQKAGLKFGGWFIGDEPLEGDRLMSENDLTLTARYKADYEIKVYLQEANEPEKFSLFEELSASGSDWEGETLSPSITPPAHFLPDESKQIVESKTLSAGENVLEYYFLRKSVNLTYHVQTPGGEQREIRQSSRYGATVVFPQSPVGEEDFEFFGWAPANNRPAEYLPEDSFILDAEDREYFGTWGKKYANVRGEGYLVVESQSGEGARGALFRTQNETMRGTFEQSTSTFTVGGTRGRLDGRGGCLLDDSGNYLAYKLRYNRASEEFGKLSLDFETGAASYSAGEISLAGSYVYEFDEDKNAYTGKYLFSSGETAFSFKLDEQNGSFLKEGSEKGSYQRYDGREYFLFEELTLDGFGGAEAKIGGSVLRGNYRGSGNFEQEWLFEGEDTFRFLICARKFGAEENKISDLAFLVYDDALSGRFEGAGTLTLDGYGISGEYRAESGEVFSGAFTREGNIVTLYAENILRFTIQGTHFAHTGAEAGVYRGAFGELLLDGAGLGTLSKSSGQTVEGNYRMLSGREVEFTSSSGDTLRAQIGSGDYQPFDSALYGSFEGSYTAKLLLDGYGGGVYTSIDSKTSFPITVGHFDGEFLEIRSENLEKPLYYQIGTDRELYLLQGPAIGKYALIEENNVTENYLLIYDRTHAKFVMGEKTRLGSFTLDASKREISFLSDGGTEKFLLGERNGSAICTRFTGDKVFRGDGTLTLDGYGTARYENGETLTGGYVETESGVDMTCGVKLIRFALEGEGINKKTVYLRYHGEEGELYLEENGSAAIYLGEEGCVENDTFIVGGEARFSYRLFGENFSFFNPAEEKELSITGGGMLSTDGCGNGTLTRGELVAEGKVTIENDLIFFTSENVKTLTKMRVFKLSENMLQPLGEEYGRYENSGENLFLDGGNGATYCGEVGTYEKYENSENEFVFTGESVRFRFRILQRDGKVCFEKFMAGLSKQSGKRETSLGTLTVNGYGVELTAKDGTKTSWKVIAASDTAFVAETPQGVRYLVISNTLSAAKETVALL